MKTLTILGRVIPAAALLAGLATAAVAAPTTTTAAADTAANQAARAALKAAPARGASGLGFIANHGQWEADVLFMTPIKGGRAWVTATGIVYDFSKAAKRKQGDSDAELAMRGKHRAGKPGAADARPQPERVKGHVVRLAFAGALQPAVRPKGKLTTRLNYLIGNDASKHARNVPAYSAVNLEGVWPGVDLRLAQGPAGLGLSFKAADAAALAKARVAVEGASVLSGVGEGAVVATSLGQRSLGAVAVSLGSARYAGQLSGGTVALAPGRQAGQVNEAQAGAASESRGALVYSTFLGGIGDDYGNALTLDASGAAYVTGRAASLDFPTTPGAYDRTYNGGGMYDVGDVFVTKLSADGSALVYSTFIGGNAGDGGRSLAVDASGAAYVTGITGSSNFPTTPGAFDTTVNGSGSVGDDVFVTKLSADGSALLYSTYLGGSYLESGAGLAVDASGAAYVTGYTWSSSFPTTPGAYDTTHTGRHADAFVTKLSADGSVLVYSTFLGGTDNDSGSGLAVDASGVAYVTGVAESSDFPTTPGAFDTTSNRHGRYNSDAFVTKLSADGSALVYSTFLGGRWDNDGWALAVDASGAAYVTGGTNSPDFPTTPGAFDTTRSRGAYDAFVAKLSADGSALVYSTFLGGTDYDIGIGLAVDAGGAAHVTGRTDSPDFPTTPGAVGGTYGGGAGDAFVSKLSVDGSTLVSSSHLGGDSADAGNALAVDASGAVYVAGSTSSSGFPTTPGAFDTSYGGGDDAFVTKLDLGAPLDISLSASATPTTVAAGGSFTVDYTISNNTDDPVTGRLTFTAARDGKDVDQGRILSSTTVAAHGTLSGSYTQAVPSNAAPGVYSYTLRIGHRPNTIQDKVVFTITVTGAAQAVGGATAWQVVGARR